MMDYIPISMVKEYTYCPRQAYLKLMIMKEPPTESMKYAKQTTNTENITKAIKQQGIQGEIKLEVPVKSTSLGIVGRVDAIAINGNRATIIETKLNIGNKKKTTHKIQPHTSPNNSIHNSRRRNNESHRRQNNNHKPRKTNNNNHKTHTKPKNMDKKNNPRNEKTHTKPRTTTKNNKQSKMQNLLLQKHMPTINHNPILFREYLAIATEARPTGLHASRTLLFSLENIRYLTVELNP